MDHLQKSLRGILHLPRAIVTELIIPLLVVDLNGRKLSSLHTQQFPGLTSCPVNVRTKHFLDIKNKICFSVNIKLAGQVLKTIVLRIPVGYSGHSI